MTSVSPLRHAIARRRRRRGRPSPASARPAIPRTAAGARRRPSRRTSSSNTSPSKNTHCVSPAMRPSRPCGLAADADFTGANRRTRSGVGVTDDRRSVVGDRHAVLALTRRRTIVRSATRQRPHRASVAHGSTVLAAASSGAGAAARIAAAAATALVRRRASRTTAIEMLARGSRCADRPARKPDGRARGSGTGRSCGRRGSETRAARASGRAIAASRVSADAISLASIGS